MSWLEFVATVVKALAWPVVVAWLVKRFAGEIKALLPQIRKLKAGSVEAEFERDVKEVLLELKPESATGEQAALLPPPQPWAGVAFAAMGSPLERIVVSWNQLEQSLRALAGRRSVLLNSDITSASGSITKVIRSLGREKVLTADQMVSLLELSRLRNDVVHGIIRPSYWAAFDFLQASSRLEQEVRLL